MRHELSDADLEIITAGKDMRRVNASADAAARAVARLGATGEKRIGSMADSFEGLMGDLRKQFGGK